MVARVSAADGLVALTGPLVRVAPALLLEVSLRAAFGAASLGLAACRCRHGTCSAAGGGAENGWKQCWRPTGLGLVAWNTDKEATLSDGVQGLQTPPAAVFMCCPALVLLPTLQ